MSLPHDKEKILNAELNSNEALIWSCEPDPIRHAIKGLPTMLFGIPFTGFSIFWIAGASGFEMPDFSEGGFAWFPLFGLPFFFVGLSILLTPLWKYLKAKKSIYAIANDRAIIFEGYFSFSVRSFKESQLEDVERIMKADGSGDLIFSREVSNVRVNNRNQVKAIGFMGIPEVKNVENLLSRVKE